MDINLPFDSSMESIDLLKLPALYYEKVNILCPVLDNYDEKVFPYSKKILDETTCLIKHGIATIAHCDIDKNNIDDDDDFIFRLVADRIGWDFEDIEGIITATINDEQILNGYNNIETDGFNLKRVFDIDDNDEIFNKPKLMKNFGVYFHSLIQLLIIYISIFNKQNVIVSKNIMADLMESICKKYSINSNKTSSELIARNAIPIFLPNFYQMNFEDIIELRYFAKDELEEMRHYINSLSLEYSPDDTQLVNVKLLLEKKIRPSIKQLEGKVYGLRVGTIQKALQAMKNPLTYTPMLTTFFSDIPSHIALAMSAGLITAEAGLEYLKQKKELEADPLFFSIELKNKVKNHFDF